MQGAPSTEANGDFDEANTILRKRGLASAAKKAGRAASEGLIGTRRRADHSSGMLVEVNCESDFVARTDDFQQLMQDVLAEIEKAGDAADRGVAEGSERPGAAAAWRPAIAQARREHGGAALRALCRPGLRRPVHPPGRQDRRAGGVRRRHAGDRAAATSSPTLVKEIAMQIAAASPSTRRATAVPADVLDKEKAIYRAQMENSGKPANVIDKIVEGKLGSFYKQVVLPDQASIRDPKMTVAAGAGGRAEDARRADRGHPLRAAQGRRSAPSNTSTGRGRQTSCTGRQRSTRAVTPHRACPASPCDL